jgi:hypothetical protein
LCAVADAVHLSQRNIAVLAHAQVKGAVIERDMGRALHHYPVLGALLMALQTELLAGVHAYALDLVA